MRIGLVCSAGAFTVRGHNQKQFYQNYSLAGVSTDRWGAPRRMTLDRRDDTRPNYHFKSPLLRKVRYGVFTPYNRPGRRKAEGRNRRAAWVLGGNGRATQQVIELLRSAVEDESFKTSHAAINALADLCRRSRHARRATDVVISVKPRYDGKRNEKSCSPNRAARPLAGGVEGSRQMMGYAGA